MIIIIPNGSFLLEAITLKKE